MRVANRHLIVLGCSASKVSAVGVLPAISLYDGPAFRVLRAFLRDYRWPSPLSVAVLSAEHGLIGGLAQIAAYDRRMTPGRAAELRPAVTSALGILGGTHRSVELVMGRGYLESIDLDLEAPGFRQRYHFADGSIGMKLRRLHGVLRRLPLERPHVPREVGDFARPLYFLPDWDDFVDADFDFSADKFSSPKRSTRREEHTTVLMRPKRICDGVVVSLAQQLGTKGMLRRVGLNSTDALAPRSVRTHFKLAPSQWAFGDCGAFSYASEDTPSISVEQAVYAYDLYEFDLGASVDHIPLPQIMRDGKKIALTDRERRSRIRLTRDNASAFISLHRDRSARFIPVGVIQGAAPKDYAGQVGDYFDMGYRHLALGGLVPRSDPEILEVVQSVTRAFTALRQRPWLHLLGIFRPRLQGQFRSLGVNSFDSATYFRKAWLRSDQNYLGPDGNWYAAIRVPPTSDPRTLLRLRDSGVSERRIRSLERAALSALHRYGKGRISLNKCLRAVGAYDSLLHRQEATEKPMLDVYRRTLERKPWKACACKVCRDVGIDVVIFRGLNRNKRRGAHNTLQLYSKIVDRGS
jgi:hypothetical protein